MEETGTGARRFFSDFFRWLDHACVELRIIDTASGTVVYQDYITNAELFADKVAEYNGSTKSWWRRARFGLEPSAWEGSLCESERG